MTTHAYNAHAYNTHALSTSGTQARLRALVSGILAEREQWLPTVRYDLADRWYQRLDVRHLDAGLDVEAWLLSWMPGQGTGLHDHGGAAGAFAVVSGALREHSVKVGRAGPPRLLTVSRRAGQLRAFGANHVHDVVNVGEVPAISIHLYSPAITTMTRYRWTRRGPVATSVERAGADW